MTDSDYRHHAGKEQKRRRSMSKTSIQQKDGNNMTEGGASKKLSRRAFFKAAAAGSAVVAGGSLLAACGNSGGGGAGEAGGTSGNTGSPGGSTGTYEVMAQFSEANRSAAPETTAPATAEEYITLKGDGALQFQPGGDPLGITPADFMLDVPAWLGVKPAISDIADTESFDALVIGAGNAGSVAAMRCQEAGLTTCLAETQTYDEYDEYACDMACYNSKLFMDKGTPYIDPMDIMNEYLRQYRGHANWQIVRDYATRSGEMLNWMVDNWIPAELTERYAKTSEYKGNANFSGTCSGQRSFIGMTQWRDVETNINMWPFVIRSLHTALEQNGGAMRWGYQGQLLVHDGANGAVSGAIFKDVEGAYHQIDAKYVIVTAGDFGGNPDMRLDLSDHMRNLAWSRGSDRSDPNSIGGMGRDGSGIRMCLWAGATMETGPRPAQSIGINGKPGMSFGGSWPVFGNDGNRFMNESLIKHGTNGYLDMLPDGFKMVSVTDNNWEKYLTYQGYGHETMDTSSDYMMEEVRANMAAYTTSADGFPVRSFARFGLEYDTQFAADTLEEVADRSGYDAAAKANFLAAITRYNEMCEKGHDDDWGCDPQNLFPINNPPFFFTPRETGGTPSNGLCQHAGVCTDGTYHVLTAEKQPIAGLYAAGNTCGQRMGIQYATPTAGNSCGSALTSGFCAADAVIADAS
jgi:succinate dehydrogenase/fumarate reductase flavoprotein subunit